LVLPFGAAFTRTRGEGLSGARDLKEGTRRRRQRLEQQRAQTFVDGGGEEALKRWRSGQARRDGWEQSARQEEAP